MQEGQPITYLNQGLTGKSLALSTYEKELLSLMMAIRKWRHYLVGQHFTVRTDQHALKYLSKQRVGTSAQQKWVSKLLGYDFYMEYKSGETNTVADALSRIPYVNQPEPTIQPISQIEPNLPTQSQTIQPNTTISHTNTTNFQLQVVSLIQTQWIEELQKSYPQDPQLQELICNYHQRIFDLTQYQIHNGLVFYKGILHLGSLVSFQQQILH